MRASVPSVVLAADSLACALQGAVDSGGRVVEVVGDLARGPVEPVAEHQYRALLGGQQLHGSDVGEADALAGDGVFLGSCVRGRELAREAVGVGLEMRVGAAGPAAALLDDPQGDVRCDSEQPRRERAVRLVARKPAPGAQERLLKRVVGVVQRAEHAVGVDVQGAPVRGGERRRPGRPPPARRRVGVGLLRRVGAAPYGLGPRSAACSAVSQPRLRCSEPSVTPNFAYSTSTDRSVGSCSSRIRFLCRWRIVPAGTRTASPGVTSTGFSAASISSASCRSTHPRRVSGSADPPRSPSAPGRQVPRR